MYSIPGKEYVILTSLIDTHTTTELIHGLPSLIKENTNEQAFFVQKLVAKDPVAEANYGESVSISRNRIAIGAPNDGVSS